MYSAFDASLILNMSSKKYDGPSEGTRRSARVIPKGAASTAGKPAPTKAPKTTKTSKKRSKAEVESEEDDDNETEEEEKPKAKKVGDRLETYCVTSF